MIPLQALISAVRFWYSMIFVIVAEWKEKKIEQKSELTANPVAVVEQPTNMCHAVFESNKSCEK